MKVCKKCQQEKDESEFYFNASRGRLDYYCKQCQREYRKVHYAGKKKYYKDKSARRKQEIREWFADYKAALKCERCGEDHPALIDFHHRDDSKKEVSLSQAITKGWGVERLKLEIAKCEVLCCRCHRLHHWNTKSGPWVWRN